MAVSLVHRDPIREHAPADCRSVGIDPLLSRGSPSLLVIHPTNPRLVWELRGRCGWIETGEKGSSRTLLVPPRNRGRALLWIGTGEDLDPFANVRRNGEFGNGRNWSTEYLLARHHGSNDPDPPWEHLAAGSPSGERRKVGLRSSGALGQGTGLAGGAECSLTLTSARPAVERLVM
ncbi:hypothetical protein R1flu_009454 [Riccia fluitans]|uniref:Uncharacterized protein n=1 Tax=Riccia fluitans TaxID=41844 RepID=A0ABD1Z6B0_9MARC